jgi:hypothetical protein
MKIAKFILIAIILSFSIGISANKPLKMSKEDSVYNDLSKFLINEGYMKEEIYNNHYREIYIFELITETMYPSIVNTPFGIYKFSYSGCDDCGYDVLIKHDDKYMVFYQNELGLILKILVKIKEENPGLINCDQFEAYVKALSNVNKGINGGSLHVYRKFGRIEHYPMN